MAAIGTTPLQDRVWVVTGATSGIGKATALGLARLGGTVVLACRDAARGGEAPQKIAPGSQKPKGTVMIVDPAGPASNFSFAGGVTPNYSRPDPPPDKTGLLPPGATTTP